MSAYPISRFSILKLTRKQTNIIGNLEEQYQVESFTSNNPTRKKRSSFKRKKDPSSVAEIKFTQGNKTNNEVLVSTEDPYLNLDQANNQEEYVNLDPFDSNSILSLSEIKIRGRV